jgi:polysaccharide biosynthesis transport protein
MVSPSKAPAALKVASRGESKDTPIKLKDLRVHSDPRGRIAEQFRTLRNSVQALNPDGAPRNLVLTSALAGEGKTTALLNLAMALVELPHLRVLVIDGNLQEPGVERRLGLPARQGLSELLEGSLDIDQAVRETIVDRLYVMGAGVPPANPSQYLGTDRMGSVLHTLKRTFDYVLIDTPAVLDYNDASLVARLADGVMIAVRLGKTPKYLVEQAAGVLEGLGANFLGTCVLGAE